MINAKYTMVLKTIMDDPVARAELDKALSEYPMYEKDPQPPYISTRKQLNEKILNHYKYREIAQETPGRFIDEFRIKMNEIMPYYVQMYKSHDIMETIDDPFGNVDIVETFEETTTGSAKGETSGTSDNTTNTNSKSDTKTNMANESKTVKTETPQGEILSINASGIDTVSHADEVTWDKNTSNSTGETTDEAESESRSTSSALSESESSGTTKHTMTKKGNQGVNTYAHDMKELRQTFLNIDKMIIEDPEIQELFMQIY